MQLKQTMENVTADTEGVLKKLNAEMARLLLPALLYICLLMATGMLGNIMVCFYYSHKAPITPTSVFIVTLSGFDLMVCSISMPTDLANMFTYYTFTNEQVCKVLRFVNYYAAIASILTLIMIAADRYKHVCRITSVQMSVCTAKKFSVLIAVVALLLSWPSALIYDSIKLPLPANMYHGNLTGVDCALTNRDSSKPYIWAYNITQAVGFFICVALLTSLYCLIGHSLYKHRQQLARYRTAISPIQGSSVAQSNPQRPQQKTEVQSTPLESEQNEITNFQARQNSPNENHSIKLENQKTQHISSQSYAQAVSAYALHKHLRPFRTTATICSSEEEDNEMDDVQRNRRAAENTGSPPPERVTEGAVDKDAVRLTLLMVTVTAVFILSFLPYLCLTIWRVYKGHHEVLFLSENQLVAFKIGSRSFLLNSSLNPWIYGIFNSRFRQYYYRKLCCR